MFAKRLISGIVLVILLVAITIPGGYILWGALLLLSLIAHRELLRAVRLCGHLKSEETLTGNKNTIGCFSDLEIMGYLGIIFYYLMMLLWPDTHVLLCCAPIILIAYSFLYVFSFPKYRADQIMMSFFCVMYAPMMLSFIYLTRSLEYGQYLVWMIFVCSWASDTCAYCVGMLFGKHRLAPVLSPKKSIEGAIGGIAGSAIVGFLISYFWYKNNMDVPGITWMTVIIAALGSMLSQVGDLAASAIKRNFEIKDYGRIIPGHGGIMDRFDSVIFTAPVIYFLTLIMIYGR
ncbi:MAG: phosphatidate cytidylyltransferase [Lachnospiraceae bacterium]|nr:phosphatidate cytidylyltransferase [Lachnospiraceae bacterium]